MGKRDIEPVHSFMKTRVSLSIEKELLLEIRAYATERKMTVSELVEMHFQKLVKPNKAPAFIEMVKNLEIAEKFADLGDLKKQYYEDNKAKYGF